MSGTANSKLKTLKLLDILNKYTDEDHPMSASELCAALGSCGITAERKSVYNDLDVLSEYGIDIIKTTSPKKGVYVGERDFQLAEVRLLIDAVQSAKFITESKTEELINKIEKNLSSWQIEMLLNQVYVDNRNKNGNEKIYYAVDGLAQAIKSGVKVRIHYIRRKIEAGERPKSEEYIYTVSPYALIWSGDHYYLICNNNRYDNLMHLRIDKIRSVTALAEKARPLCEVSDYCDVFDAADYSSKVFNMFSGTPESVELRCANELFEVITDRFGEDIRIINRTEDTFTVSVTAAVSDGLAAWLLQYGEKMIVLSPKKLGDAVHKKAQETADAYLSLQAVGKE